MEYYTITTNACDAAIAQALQTGISKTFKKLAVGDGNGSYYEPAKTQTALRREVWRGDAVTLVDPDNPRRVIVEADIPANVGGFTVREAGIFDEAGTMMVVSKQPLSEKVAPESGASNDMVIRLRAEVSDASAVTITVDQSAIRATKADVKAAGDKAAADLTAHASDAVVHVTQADHDKINGAVQTATIGGAAVPKSGTTLQLPAYPVIPSSLPANGGTADYAHYSSHAVGSGGAALRNNAATVGGSPSGGSDGDGWDICT
ncbi:phage tail protein [Clostridium sp. KNHs216]|uniref:phage tail protein n=1 Tax=Clostridium sp. KNHs216 TaxID=1550235 RepID=UPI001151CFCB|nr:phage tail protein [Clostridium sp. KNHs216]TQI66723.1 tail-collar fiber protein [Clostridium sp. KNHs216]